MRRDDTNNYAPNSSRRCAQGRGVDADTSKVARSPLSASQRHLMRRVLLHVLHLDTHQLVLHNMHMGTVDRASVRKSVPLSERDRRDLDRMRASSVHRDSLREIAGVEIDEDASDAALLRVVVEAGINAVERQVESVGYAQIAADIDRSERKAVARRRRPTWADE